MRIVGSPRFHIRAHGLSPPSVFLSRGGTASELLHFEHLALALKDLLDADFITMHIDTIVNRMLTEADFCWYLRLRLVLYCTGIIN